MKKRIVFLMCLLVSANLFACSDKVDSKSNIGTSDASKTSSIQTSSNAESSVGSSNSGNSQSNSSSGNSKTTSEADISNKKLGEILDTLCKETKAPAYDLIDLDKKSFELYSFIPWVEGIEATVSEGLISTSAHSIVLIRVNGADSAKIAGDIAEKADLRKWICVSAEKGKVLYTDKYVLMIMTYKKTCDDIEANFKKLMSGDEVKSFEIKDKFKE